MPDWAIALIAVTAGYLLAELRHYIDNKWNN